MLQDFRTESFCNATKVVPLCKILDSGHDLFPAEIMSFQKLVRFSVKGIVKEKSDFQILAVSVTGNIIELVFCLVYISFFQK